MWNKTTRAPTRAGLGSYTDLLGGLFQQPFGLMMEEKNSNNIPF